MQKRMQTFTERTVGQREQLYEPDPDHDANWDWIAGMCWAFAGAGVLILFGIICLVF